jgi:hypothetical protein
MRNPLDLDGRLARPAGALLALLFCAAPLSAQNRQIELEWLRNAGATFAGDVAGDQAGFAIDSAGDMNNDGYDDVVITSWMSQPGGKISAGRIYVQYGGLSVTGTYDLAIADVVIEGETAFWKAGFSVAGAGDVNDDGFDDLLIGARDAETNNNTGSGRCYLVYGGAALPAVISLASLGSDGVTINGIGFSDVAGSSVAGPGDVNNDGFDDMVIGAPGAGHAGLGFAGEVYIVYGSDTLPSLLELSSLALSGGVTINGASSSDQSGLMVAAAGDVNNDGFMDVLLGAPLADPFGKNLAGEASIVYGGNALPSVINLASLGSAGVLLNGSVAGGKLGLSGSGAGDVNGDGFDDVILSVKVYNGPGGEKSGRSYVYYGGDSLPDSISVDTIGSGGIIFDGIDANDQSGASVAAGGDFNMDGYADLLIGAGGADPNSTANSGEIYMIEGGPTLLSSYDLATIDANGTVLAGISMNDTAGNSLAFAGDVNNDGFDDVLMAAWGADPSGKSGAGEVYLVYGTCNFIQAAGTVAEGGSLNLRIHGTPSVPYLLIAGVFANATPVQTQFGPIYLPTFFDLLLFSYSSNGESLLPIAMPAPGAIPGLLGLTFYMQALGQPQGNNCDATYLLAVTIE